MVRLDCVRQKLLLGCGGLETSSHGSQGTRVFDFFQALYNSPSTLYFCSIFILTPNAWSQTRSQSAIGGTQGSA